MLLVHQQKMGSFKTKGNTAVKMAKAQYLSIILCPLPRTHGVLRWRFPNWVRHIGKMVGNTSQLRILENGQLTAGGLNWFPKQNRRNEKIIVSSKHHQGGHRSTKDLTLSYRYHENQGAFAHNQAHIDLQMQPGLNSQRNTQSITKWLQ